MPEPFRLPVRMDCKGINLAAAIDRMPPGFFPYLFNARVLAEGRLESRPGYTALIAMADPPNSIRRLNDPAAATYIYVGGGAGNLYAGQEGGYAVVDAGYSGDPLSLIQFRPEASPQSWMYVYDRSRQRKVNPSSVVRNIGVAPPTVAPSIEYGVPAWVSVDAGQASAGWGFTNPPITALADVDRTVTGAFTISSILYNTGAVGWCCITPSAGDTSWAGERMTVVLTGGTIETVVVREIHPAITATTVAEIQYDTGTTGDCSLVLTGSIEGLARNSIITITNGGAQVSVCRVLEVVPSPDGLLYSVRTNTQFANLAGNAVAGRVSWYTYTVGTFAAADTITCLYIAATQGAAGTGNITKKIVESCALAGGRPISPANDYLHLSVFLNTPANVVDVKIKIDIDAGTAAGTAFTGDYWMWTIPLSQLSVSLTSVGVWAEIVVPISSGTRFGYDFSRTLANVQAVGVSLTTTGACNWGWDDFYLFGTYGPTIQPNAPEGYRYACRFRDLTTGAASVPGPPTRYSLDPLREEVLVVNPTSSDAAVNDVDDYRVGGTLSQLLYVASTANGGTLADTIPDTTVLAIGQPVDLTKLQPWPILVQAWQGTCNVVGTSVTWVSGTTFDLKLLNSSVILINGVALLTYGQPRSSTFLELQLDGGNQVGVPFQVLSPTLAAQPLAFAMGPLEGPIAPVVFALGDPINGGTLYYSNFSDADSAADTNTIELSPPSANLVSGATWNGLVFVGSREDVFVVRFTYLTGLNSALLTPGLQSFQWSKIPAPSGMWSRWACCSSPIGVAYLGRDGIYVATEQGAVNITDEALYPLFPHDGQAASTITYGANTIQPVDMTQTKYLRLAYADEDILFSYLDIGGNHITLRYQIAYKRWFLHNYADSVGAFYLVEPSVAAPNTQQLLLLNRYSGAIYLSGGNTDGAAAVTTIVLTPSIDGGDERGQKIFTDQMIQVDGSGTMQIAAVYNSAQTFGAVQNLACTGSVQQTPLSLSSYPLALYRNIACKFVWTGGPAGPRLYAWEPSGYLQPYLTKHIATQFLNLSFPGWKHARRYYPSLISTAAADFTIRCQDGRTYGPYSIPSTGGVLRILPGILDHGIKDLAFAFQLESGTEFVMFPDDFTVEYKEWTEPSYIDLAVFKT